MVKILVNIVTLLGLWDGIGWTLIPNIINLILRSVLFQPNSPDVSLAAAVHLVNQVLTHWP